MSVVILGQNRFIDCETILGYKGTPILKVRFNPLRLELTTPPGVPSRQIRVGHDGGRSDDEHVRVVAGPQSFAVFLDEHALAVATLLDSDTAHLKLDLRPLGMNIYDDFEGLHIGQNTFSGNEVRQSATAIALGD
jgi:hypothetical protein